MTHYENCVVPPEVAIVKGISQTPRVVEFSEDQQRALDFVDKFMKSGRKSAVIGGIAGSGKSTIIPEMIRRHGSAFGNCGDDGVAVCAYTGKAVVVLKRKGILSAQTLHSFLYRTEVIKDDDGNAKVNFIKKQPYEFGGVKLLIVDEASMVNRQMYEFIGTLPFKTVYIGDHFQLPPVGDDFNIMQNPDIRLEKVLRQNEGNPVIRLAEMARNGEKIPPGTYGTSECRLGCDTKTLSEYDQVLAWTNAKTSEINDAIRSERGFPTAVPQYEDKMIVMANCQEKNVYNGQIVYLVGNPKRMSDGSYKVSFVDELVYEDAYYGVVADDPMTARASVHLTKQEIEEWRMKRYAKGRSGKSQKGLPDYEIHLDWGYCITVHKAQGSSWKNVAVIDERRMHWLKDYNRWLYTAITRAEESVTIFKI